ncbi:MAG: hypothetical protein H7Y02_00015 [Candidatus Obscuribacterales bacterium]|nr:hypothetical protein [Steroidobacteraceae bacterium]
MKTIIAGFAALLLSACSFFDKTELLIPTELISAPSKEHNRLVLVLPGRGDDLAAMRNSGIAAALQQKVPDTDVLLVEMTLPYYVEGRAMERLHKEIVLPAQQRGYREIYLAGASFGGMGALMYERDHFAELAGIILMAPYMGDPTIVEDIKAAGGLRNWDAGRPEPNLNPINASREEWRVVQSWLTNTERAQHVWLICGREDGFFEAANVVAQALLPSHFIPVDGGHKWTVWSQGAAKAFAMIVANKPI